MKKNRMAFQFQKSCCGRQLWHVMSRSMVLCGLLVAMWGGSGCSEDGADRVILFAASSMSEVLGDVESVFEETHPGIDLECVFAGSQTLAMQINQGAPADLFLSADHEQMMRVEGFKTPVVLAENRLVLITHSGPTGTSVIEAINRASRIVVAHGDVPAGHYTRSALDELGVWDITEPKIVSYEHSVRGVLTKIVLGQADIGFVYRTDALSESDSISMIEFPESISTTTQAWIAMRNDAEIVNPYLSIAYRFILDSLESQRVFADHGFGSTKGAP